MLRISYIFHAQQVQKNLFQERTLFSRNRQYGCNKIQIFIFILDLNKYFQKKHNERKLYPKNRFVWGIEEFLEKKVFRALSFLVHFSRNIPSGLKSVYIFLTPMLTYFEKKMFALRKDSFSHKNMNSAAQR